MELKLVNGKWKAVFEGVCKDYNTLTDVDKKLFSLLFNCEIILYKLNIKHEFEKNRNQNINKLKKIL